MRFEQFLGVRLEPRPDLSSAASSRAQPSPPAPVPESMKAPVRQPPARQQYPAPPIRDKVFSGPRPAPAQSPPARPSDTPGGATAPARVNWAALDAKIRERLRLEHYAYPERAAGVYAAAG
jgi:hypothetical protein